MLGLINWDYLSMIEYSSNIMTESDNYQRLIKDAQSNPLIRKTIEEVESFNTYAKSMGIPTNKKQILRSREEMKFDYIKSNGLL